MKRLSGTHRPSLRRATPYAAVAAAIGIVAVILVRAAGIAVALEPEAGTLSGGAKTVSLSGASGGRAVQFGASGPAPTPAPAPTPVPPPSTPTPAAGIWRPTAGLTWQWQLTTPVDTSVAAQAFDIDGFENAASVVAAIHAKGAKAICYISAGSHENFRPDAGSFPASVIGRTNGWAGEKWLDIRQISILGPLMNARMDMCKAKGFDGMEFDNIDGYLNSTGFPLTAAHQTAYNKYLADQAHARGLAAFLKNDGDQAAAQVGFFEGVIVEQCFQYSECDLYQPFITAGKPVLEVEYSLSTSAFCSQANTRRFSAMKKNLDLTAARTTCW